MIAKAEAFSIADPGPDGLAYLSYGSGGKRHTVLIAPDQLWYIEARAAAIRAKLTPVPPQDEPEEVPFS